MGYSPRAEIFNVTSSIPTIALQLRGWKKAQEDVQKLMIKVQKKWTKGKTLEQKYKTGDQVWLEGCNLRIDRPSIKLAPKRHGPFKIKKVLSPITYQLELPPQWKIHDIFHVDLLTPYHETKLVMFKWNIRLDLSRVAATKSFGALLAQLPFEVFGESTRALCVGMIHGERRRGRYPRRTRWFKGSVGSAHFDLIDTRTQT